MSDHASQIRRLLANESAKRKVRLGCGAFCALLVAWLAFWIVVITVVVHFIRKFW